MPVSPEDLTRKTFPVVLRGYDKEEVDLFLQELATELAGGRPSGDPYAALGDEVTAVLRTAHDTAASKLQEVEAEAKNVRRNAREEAAAGLQKAREEAAQVLEQAQASAGSTIAAAEESARQLRAEADRYSEETRAAAEASAQETRRNVDDYAAQVRAKTDAERSSILDDALAKHALLRRHEEAVERRISYVEEALGTLRSTLEQDASEIAEVDEVLQAESGPPAEVVQEVEEEPESWVPSAWGTVEQEPVAEEPAARSRIEERLRGAAAERAVEEGPAEADASAEQVEGTELVPESDEPEGRAADEDDAESPQVWNPDEIERSETGPRPTPLTPPESKSG